VLRAFRARENVREIAAKFSVHTLRPQQVKLLEDSFATPT